MRTIILSYDYEIFFGDKSGTIERSLIVPTNFLLDKMDELGIKGNFFIDYLMLKCLRKIDTERTARDIQLIETQIKDIVRRGHRIELHLHPRWIDAQYNGDGTWNFQNYTHYALSSLGESAVINMFKEGTAYLNNLAQEVEPGYTICAFRAGGWAIQPFHKIKKAFLEANIKIDSSISYGAYGKNQYSSFDFLNAPDKVMYRFEDDVCKEVDDGQFWEIPISSFHRIIFYRVIDKVHRVLSKRLSHITDGSHRRQDLKYIKRENNMAMMTLSRISPISVIISALLNKKEILVFIDHPKDFSYSSLQSIKLLSYFFKSTTYYNCSQL